MLAPRLSPRGLAAAAALLVACVGSPTTEPPSPGGPTITSFTADPPALYPREAVRLLPVFSGGTGSIEPGIGPVRSGEAVVLKPGTAPGAWRLRVEGSGSAVEATVSLAVDYRHRLDATPSGLPRADHAAALMSDGRVLLAGGLSGTGYEWRTEVLDPLTGSVTAGADLPTPHADAAIAVDAKGTVLVSGGLDPDPVDDVYSRYVHGWIAASGEWVRFADMLERRLHHTATPLPDGRVLIAGGAFLARNPTSTATEELYHPAEGPRRPAGGALLVPRYEHTATPLADGRILIAGGRNAFTDQVVSTAELYDPSEESFTSIGSLASGRAAHVAVPLAGGRVLLAGGDTDTEFPTASAEIFDSADLSFTPTGSMSHARIFHAAAPLAHGGALVVGGFDAAGDGLAEIEVYDPASGTFSARAALPSGRTGVRVVALPDGAVLIHGGRDASGLAVADAHLYR